LQEVANPAYLSDFLFSGLLRVAPYCVPGGIRVVSIALSYPCDAFLHAYGSWRFIFDKRSLVPLRLPPG
jgi:hypothetical protein